MSADTQKISVVIPTYQRGEILLRTLQHLLALSDPPGEILVVDQTEKHPVEVLEKFQALEKGIVRRITLSPPSIPHAMNVGLREAKGKVVLFLDDDIVPFPKLVEAHADAHDGSIAAVCGQVLQPGQEAECSPVRGIQSSGLRKDLDFPFNSTEPAELSNVMAGNLSVCREAALSIGGFDENFIGVAYRFETDFARRLVAAGYRIQFSPNASIRHLRLSSGGTRTAGDHLRNPSPLHSMGDYYFALRHGRGIERVVYVFRRLFQETVNRYYLRCPWMLPNKVWSEFQGLELAMRLHRAGPHLISAKEEEARRE